MRKRGARGEEGADEIVPSSPLHLSTPMSLFWLSHPNFQAAEMPKADLLCRLRSTETLGTHANWNRVLQWGALPEMDAYVNGWKENLNTGRKNEIRPSVMKTMNIHCINSIFCIQALLSAEEQNVKWAQNLANANLGMKDPVVWERRDFDQQIKHRFSNIPENVK